MAKKEKVKKINKTNLYLIISIIILGFFGGYFYWQNKKLTPIISSIQTTNIFSLTNEEEIIKIITPLAENFIQNFVAGNFVKASQNFDNEMKITVNTQVLETVHGEILGKIGDMLDLGQPKITKKEVNFLFLDYPEAKFSQEEKVLIRTVFKNDVQGNLKISGFGFDSPKLNSN